jgi:uracil-DNA glycosylase
MPLLHLIAQKTPNVLILKSAHPSPLSASRGFLGNGHFKKANDWLESENRYGKNGGIQWGKL